MYLFIHPSGLDNEWMLFRVPNGQCKIAREVAAEFVARTGKEAEAWSNRDARGLKSIAKWAKGNRRSSTRATVIEDPSVFEEVFLRDAD